MTISPTTLQDAVAKAPEPTRTNRLREMAQTVAWYLMLAMASIVILTILIAVAHAGNHACGSCDEFLDGIRYHYEDSPNQYGIAAAPG